jgi:hypothetical protein
MNVREGIRRLALFVGMVGAFAGTFGSYMETQEILRQTSTYDKFEQLAKSDTVQKERKCRMAGFPSGCSQAQEPPLPPGYTFVVPDPQYKDTFDPSELNKGDLKTIYWTGEKRYMIKSIETMDGDTVYPSSLPSRWLYLLTVTLPLLGFVFPWGLIRSMQWVVMGFTQTHK